MRAGELIETRQILFRHGQLSRSALRRALNWSPSSLDSIQILDLKLAFGAEKFSEIVLIACLKQRGKGDRHEPDPAMTTMILWYLYPTVFLLPAPFTTLKHD